MHHTGTGAKHHKQSSSPKSPLRENGKCIPYADLGGREISSKELSTSPAHPPRVQSAEEDNVSECGTEYPDSDASFDACSADAAQDGEAPERGLLPPSDEATGGQAPPADCRDAAHVQGVTAQHKEDEAREQSGCMPIKGQRQGAAPGLDDEGAAFSETQYPETELIDTFEALSSLSTEPKAEKSGQTVPLDQQGMPKDSQPAQSQQPSNVQPGFSETQYPDDEALAGEEAGAVRKRDAPVLAVAHGDAEHDDVGPAATQYPESDEEVGPSQQHPPRQSPDKGGTGDPSLAQRDLQDADDVDAVGTQYPASDEEYPSQPLAGHSTHGGAGIGVAAVAQASVQPVVEDPDDVPQATQYPDFDTEDGIAQGTSGMQEASVAEQAEPYPDEHSDYDAELDQFLAEQV